MAQRAALTSNRAAFPSRCFELERPLLVRRQVSLDGHLGRAVNGTYPSRSSTRARRRFPLTRTATLWLGTNPKSILADPFPKLSAGALPGASC
jgi:hypothetical protein